MGMQELAAVRSGRPAPFGDTARGLEIPQAFIEKLPLAIYACDTKERILWFNRLAVELWGREPRIGGDSEKYSALSEVYVNGRVCRDETPIAAVLRTGVAVRAVEGKIARPDGSSIWIMMHIEPVVDEDGAIVGAINCFHDASALPLRSEQHHGPATTYEQVGAGIAEVDTAGKILKVNAHLVALLGYQPKELLGCSIFDPTFGERPESDEAQFRRQVKGEIDHYSIDKRCRRRDGSMVWASVASVRVCDSDGRFLRAVRVLQDISARKRAEELATRRAEEQAALYHFLEELQRTAELDDMCAKAMAALFRALACDRASILLFDESQVLRFVAAKGLSDTYRRAAEGHAPWPDGKDSAPICIEDIERSDLAADLKAVVRAEEIASLAIIPIAAGGRLLGKLMTYYDRPHVYSEAETNLAHALARQLGIAIERTRSETARQRAESAAQQLVAIVESSHDAIISKDLNGVIATWNQSAERLFGYTAEEAVGKPVTILIPPDRLDEEPQILSRIRRGELVDHFETIRRRRDGTLIDISLTISPVRDAHGKIVGASKIARDITESKEAEAKLQDSEQRLRELLAAIPAAIYTTDARGRITYFNDKVVEFAGRTPTLGSDKWCVTWKMYWPDGTPLPHDECPMAVALKEGRPIRNVEAVAERPDGTRVPFIPYPTPLRDGKGNIVGAINMLVDVSERKQAETQQRILFNELNHRVKNNMQTLQALLNLAGRKTRSVETQAILNEASGRIAAMAAAQKVLYGTSDATRFSAQEFLDAVCQTAQQTFSRDVTVMCEAGDLNLSNDAAMPLALILNELLTNAVKHGLDRGAATGVRVGLTRQNDLFVLYVEDDGPGFDLQSVHQRSSGLQLVQGLARQLGGEFKVTRDPTTRCSVQFS